MHVSKAILNLLGRNPTGDLGHLTAYTSRRHGSVWFTKSPPLTPPNKWQIRQRDRFRLAAILWSELNENSRQRWHRAARTCRLIVHGYTLFLWWHLRRDRPALATIERQSGLTLI